MKKLILIITSIFLCINIFAQEENTCQFIGLYDQKNSGNCIERQFVHEDVLDFADYNSKKKQFIETHKKENPNTRFIKAQESIIAYKFEKGMAGSKCNSIAIGIKSGKSIEDCNKQLADHLAKYPKDFLTQPYTIFTWQGKGTNSSEYTKDFGGLKGKFISGNTATKSIIVAQFTNQTNDKLASVELSLDGGAVIKVTVNPGITLTRKYDAKKIEIQVEYMDITAPKPSFDIIEITKRKVREIIINENGKIKPMPSSTITGVRG